jgi:hypothetical protein
VTQEVVLGSYELVFDPKVLAWVYVGSDDICFNNKFENNMVMVAKIEE